MTEFFQALTDPNFPFLRTALVMGILASIAFGISGSFVVARRITYIAGAIAHAVLGGIGIALYLREAHGWSFADPMAGATIAALSSAVLIAWIKMKSFEREDSLIGAVWAGGMATGLIFLSITPGYTDPMSYLFGNILILSSRDLWMVAMLDIVLLAIGILGYRHLQAICFDEEFSRIRGIKVGLYYTLLLCMVALSVVLLVSVVGVVLVVALLTLPAAIASQFSRSLVGMMAIGSLLCLAFIVSGLGLSYQLDLPSGAIIILIACIGYGGSSILQHFRNANR